jgi:hypothetical protein
MALFHQIFEGPIGTGADNILAKVQSSSCTVGARLDGTRKSTCISQNVYYFQKNKSG